MNFPRWSRIAENDSMGPLAATFYHALYLDGSWAEINSYQVFEIVELVKAKSFVHAETV